MAVFLGCTSTGRVDLCFLWFYVQELPKAQLVVVLVLKRLRRRGNGLKSHPTDWEKPGIEPATPGLQDIGLSPTPRRRFEDKWFKVRNRANTWPYLMRYYVSSASACADPGHFTKWGGGGRGSRPT